ELRGDAPLGGDPGHQAGLGDRVGARLLAIDVLAPAHGHDAGRGVVVVGRADDDRVDVAVPLVEHLPVVVVLGGVLEHVEGAGGAWLAWALSSQVHIAQGDDLLAGDAAPCEILLLPAGDDGQVAPAPAPGPDDGDVHALVGPHHPGIRAGR